MGPHGLHIPRAKQYQFNFKFNLIICAHIQQQIIHSPIKLE